VGKHFCAGIDLTMLMGIQASLKIECEGRKRETLRGMIAYLQDCISSIEKCRKPVLAAVQKACLGAGFAIATACDMRYCTEDAYFSVKEIDRGMVADVGTSQRLPKIIPYALACELAYTGRNVGGEEAKEIGLVNRVYANKEIMMEEVMKLAAMIATKSPLSIRGTKHIYKYSRDHSVQEGLDYMQTWNAAMFLSDDLTAAFQGVVEKKEPVYKN
jgi:enoyl-CoA hydratase